MKVGSLRVLRLCSVFEPPPEVLGGRGTRFDPIGGMQNHTGELTRLLDRRGVGQTVITTRPPGAPRFQKVGERSVVTRLGLPIRRFRQLYSVPALPLAYRTAANVDLVHVHLGEDIAILPIGMAAAARRRLPLVLTIHCSLRHTLEVMDGRTLVLKTLGGWIEKRAERRAAAVIAITPRLARCLGADELDRDVVRMIPPGVNRDLFSGPRRDPFPYIPRPRIVFVGRLTRQKGVHTLVDAMSLLPDRDVRLIMVGDGPERRPLNEKIDALGLRERVHMSGFLDHDLVPDVLAHADLLVLPSLYEELGSILLEAMQLGLAVVASRVGGIPEVIRDGENGLLVPPADPRELASAMSRVLSDAALRKRMSSEALKRATEYDWNSVADRVLEIYSEVLARPRKSGQRVGL